MSDRIIPLLIISCLLLLIDWYIFKALTPIIEKRWSKSSRPFKFIWWGYSILLIAGVFASIFLNLILAVRAVILVAFFITFVTKVFFLPFLFIDDIRRGVVWARRKRGGFKHTGEVPAQDNPEKISRSEFLVKAGIAVAAIPFASLSWGIIEGGYDYRVKRRTLYFPNLPKAFDGITLGQISDIHSGSFYRRKAVLGGVEMLMAEKPDFIFFTGDLVNNVASEMKDYQDIFNKVKAPLGVFSVLGNHDYGDYYFGREPSPAKAKNLADIKTIHKNMGYDLLLNENRRLKINGEEIAILGVENWGAGRFVRHGRLDLAMKGTEDAPLKLLLSHDPSHWRAQVLGYTDIDATFSGHTHGMQFGVRTKEYQWSPVQYIYKEWAGLYQEKQQQLYVNVGYGFLGYPGRVGILPEITIFELKRA
ncbi:metallophosphoesterase [Arcticibacter tournemirensis]|uniref:Metallophosphoesterase n=1 Tax=Arcticibacter tournemirensis TaxID=699437 RepID=A0A4Q0M3K6_9SPHI|nr:metallophosphoesterase [Arcticibacter tournemirensis]RXF67491.1 metallophosphoesterase [Arcticibacter tournemirensis]